LEIDNHPNHASPTAVSGVCHYEYVTAWDSKRDPWYTGVLKVEGELSTYVVRPDAKVMFMVPGGVDEDGVAPWLTKNGWTACARRRE
jgi:hypothetical protein